MKDGVPRSLPKLPSQLVLIIQKKKKKNTVSLCKSYSLNCKTSNLEDCSWSWRHAWGESATEETWLVKTLELPQRLLNSSSAKYKFYSCTTQHVQPYWYFCRCSDIQTSWFFNMPLHFIWCQTVYPTEVKLLQLPPDAGSPPRENNWLFFRYFP